MFADRNMMLLAALLVIFAASEARRPANVNFNEEDGYFNVDDLLYTENSIKPPPPPPGPPPPPSAPATQGRKFNPEYESIKPRIILRPEQPTGFISETIFSTPITLASKSLVDEYASKYCIPKNMTKKKVEVKRDGTWETVGFLDEKEQTKLQLALMATAKSLNVKGATRDEEIKPVLKAIKSHSSNLLSVDVSHLNGLIPSMNKERTEYPAIEQAKAWQAKHQTDYDVQFPKLAPAEKYILKIMPYFYEIVDMLNFLVNEIQIPETLKLLDDQADRLLKALDGITDIMPQIDAVVKGAFELIKTLTEETPSGQPPRGITLTAVANLCSLKPNANSKETLMDLVAKHVETSGKPDTKDLKPNMDALQLFEPTKINLLDLESFLDTIESDIKKALDLEIPIESRPFFVKFFSKYQDAMQQYSSQVQVVREKNASIREMIGNFIRHFGQQPIFYDCKSLAGDARRKLADAKSLCKPNEDFVEYRITNQMFLQILQDIAACWDSAMKRVRITR